MGEKKIVSKIGALSYSRDLDHVCEERPLFTTKRVQRYSQCCAVRTHIACLGSFDGHRLGRDQGPLVGQGVRIPHLDAAAAREGERNRKEEKVRRKRDGTTADRLCKRSPEGMGLLTGAALAASCFLLLKLSI